MGADWWVDGRLVAGRTGWALGLEGAFEGEGGLAEPVSSAEALDGFSTATRAWFEGAFAVPTQAQAQAWRAIGKGEDTLVIAPTGSGKTLAAFLWAIDRLAATPPPADRKRRCPGALRVAAEGAGGRHRAEPAVAADRDRAGGAPARAARARRSRWRCGPATPPPTSGARSSAHPPDILITTPESLFLLLTSQARDTLRGVETVIVDEVHAVAGTKRGAHLALSLERLDALRGDAGGGRAQRVGLSATVRPADRGGHVPRRGAAGDGGAAGQRQADRARGHRPGRGHAATCGEPRAGRRAASDDPVPRRSIWPHVEERVLDLIQAHRSTIVFANSRRLAERLCGRLNELATERACAAAAAAARGARRPGRSIRTGPAGPGTWPGPGPGASPAGRDRGHRAGAPRVGLAGQERAEIEEALKAGRLPAVVATSSLELGIDMGAVDLVIQVESPPSVASGLQRVGRAGHNVGDVSRGVIFPKYAGDLIQASVVAERMQDAGDRGAAHPPQPARRARPAGRGDGRARRLGGRRARGGGPPGGPVQRADQAGARGRARHAGRPVPGRGVRRAEAAGRVGPGGRGDPRAAGRAAAGGDQRRHHPRPRLLRRVPGLWRRLRSGRDRRRRRDDHRPRGRGPAAEAGRRARRGDGVRVAGRRRVRARRLVLADRGHHAGPGAGAARAGPAGQAAVLARRHARAARPSSARRSARRSASWRRCPRTRAVASLRDGGLDELAARNLVRYLAEQRQATGHVPDDRTLVRRAVPRRARRLAGGAALPVRRPGARAVGARHHRPAARALRRDGRAGAAHRRRDHHPGARLRRAAARRDRAARPGGDRRHHHRRGRRLRAVRLPVPRVRGPGAAAPPAAAGAAHARCGSSGSGRRQLLEIAAQFPGFPITLETVRECLQDVFDVPGADRGAPRPGRPPDPAGRGGDGHPEPVRSEPALPLRRRVHVRGGRAAGRAAGAGARARPGAAGGAARHRGAAGAARPGRGGGDRGRPAAPVGRPPHAATPRRWPTCCARPGR